MKKFFAFFAAMMLAVVSYAADVTVYFHNTEGWKSVYAYVWTPSPASWPGEKMSPTNMENYYAYVLTGDQQNIIFTNGTGVKTADLVVEAGRCFEWVNGTTTTWGDAPEGIQIEEGEGGGVTETMDVTVRVYTEEAAPKIWWWGGGINSAEKTYKWEDRPAMEQEGETNWYTWTFKGVNKDLGISYKITATNEREFTNVKENNCYDANLDLLDCDYASSKTDPELGEEATVRVRIDASVDDWKFGEEGRGVYFYVWTVGKGSFIQATFEDGWYSYTNETTPFNFIVVNTNEWTDYTSLQSVNMEGVTESACYLMKAGERVEGNGASWKCVLETADCDAATAIINANDNVVATKVIENGQLIIIRDGVRYNAVGAAL